MRTVFLSLVFVVLMTNTSFSQMIIEGGWARPTIKERPGVGYAVIINHGAADRLISAHSPRVKKIEIHTHLSEDGIMRMRRIEGIDVPMHGTAELKPHGHHLMLFGLNKPLKKNDEIELILVFEKAGEIKTRLEVLTKAPAATSVVDDDDNHQHHHHER